ncbi:MAG: MoaD/ThiS family protein [Chromatiales bacterium]|nr:MoaD/ThiS family protein [Chromatiales bacterium]
MRVQVTAAGLLEEFLPEGSDGEMTVEAPAEATLVAVMQAAGIPESAKPLISLNGTVVPRSQHAERTVSDGDTVHFMPNLKGG